jgi:hypothetical protein
MTKNAKKAIVFFSFLIKNCKNASMKDVQATGEAFHPQKRTPSTSEDEMYQLFSIFLCHFCPF